MTSTTAGGEWTYLYFEVAHAIDRGVEMGVEEAEHAARSGYVTDVLERYYEIDLSALDGDECAAIDEAFQEHATEPSRLGIEENGLVYLSSLVFTVLRSGEWVDPEPGESVDFDKLYLAGSYE